MVGWGGCECDGLVSNTVIVNVSHINPSLIGQPQSSVFQSHCVCCHFNQCVGAAVLSHFCLCPIPFLIGHCHSIVVCTMSCVSVLGWLVCCVMSSDGVRGVDDVVCLTVHSQKKAAQHTALFPCDGVHQCVMVYGGLWVSVSVCCGVVGARGKKGRGKDTVKQKQKGLFPKPLFPFSLFSTSFSSTLFSLPSTLPSSLPSYPYTHLLFMLHT